MKKILIIIILSFIGIQNISAESVYMKVGETRTLSPSILLSKTLAGQPAWTSSHPNNVEIYSQSMYSCVIKAVKSFSGYATIHCLYYYNELDPSGKYIYQRSGYVDYEVYVEEDKATSITISPTNVELKFAETIEMQVLVSPSSASQEVTWSSTDPSVAKVNSMNILGANGYGTATVTATTSNGLTASCKVTVKKNGGNEDNNETGGNNDNKNNNVNYDEVDYYYQITKKRMNALREITIQLHDRL